MSILVKPYEISVWDDVWDSNADSGKGKFVEKRLGIIGTDNMISQNRVLEPVLTRNTNGTKKLSFKMYKRYIDIISGEEVENPIVDWLVSERKIKLKYGTYTDSNGVEKDQWYDFIIKNIVENSSNYLYTYQLEDALVQELSKNGFGITLDAELMNNMGTAETLANYVLEDTDWKVSSEALVEKVEENLVYVHIPAETQVTPIIDQSALENGIDFGDNQEVGPNGWDVLAFYSSCTNKPHRFQFIYISEGYSKAEGGGKSVSTDENRIINVANCQYFCEIAQPESAGKYVQNATYKQFYLPENFTIISMTPSSVDDKVDTPISTWYRGARYGFSPSAKYIPLLERYCNEYTKNGEKYYGYVDNDYASPALLQNIITNTEFKSTTGWVGAYTGTTPNVKSSYGATIEAVYGHFPNGFSSVIDELTNGSYNSKTVYTPYLKIYFPTNNGETDKGILLNTGFYDNRTLINSIEYKEEWYFEPVILNTNGVKIDNPFDIFDFYLEEVSFNTTTGAYTRGKRWAAISADTKTVKNSKNEDISVHYFQFNDALPEGGSDTLADVKMSEKEFDKKKVNLVIIPKNYNQIYYIQDIQLFKLILNDKGQIIKPGDVDVDGVVTTTHKFFSAKYVEEVNSNKDNIVTDTKDIEYDTFDKKDVNYSTYIPTYNESGQKVRSVTAKESNYFNILQNIAETFEAWIDFEIKRDDPNYPGAITEKWVKFKNYVGKNNHAAFRYGVNLKDIQRTYESKNIVTKLMVKQNSNELGKDGFCTIARAGSNPTGESHIYDFRYFHDRGMIDSKEYLASLYYASNPLAPSISPIVEEGPDVCMDSDHGQINHKCKDYNLQNYFNRIKNLNTSIVNANNTIAPLVTELTKYKADLVVQEGLRDAASEGLEEVREDFHTLTGLTPETISQDNFDTITCEVPDKDATGKDDDGNQTGGAGVNILNSQDWAKNATVERERVGSASNSVEWKFNITLQDTPKPVTCTKKINSDATWNSSESTLQKNSIWSGLKIVYTYTQNKYYKLSYKLTTTDNNMSILGGDNAAFTNTLLRIKRGGDDAPWIEITGENSYSTFSDVQSGETFQVESYGTYNMASITDTTKIESNCFFIQPNRGIDQATTCKIENIILNEYDQNLSDYERTIYIQPIFTLIKYKKDENGGKTTEETKIIKTPEISCTIPAYSNTTTHDYSLAIVDTTASNIQNLLTEYATYMTQYNESIKQIDGYTDENDTEHTGLEVIITEKEEEILNKQKEVEALLEHKKALNKLFYTRYSRFIQEGTWISEEYVDDDKYYNDALSVMYTSCYPQVVYSINILALSGLPGYEAYDFDVGDKTYVIDPEFFGDDYQEEVIINEMSNNLDEPSKDIIKVQNFKNQFQDLFQKITATVQQAQYSSGSYKKAVALAEANAAVKSEFLQDALSDASNRLIAAGQTSVVQGVDGITLTDESTKDQMRLIGGAILMSTQDENGERKWKTGLTPDGISASLVTAGTINTGNISIMNGKDATFMWNAYGLSAFDVDWTNGEITGIPRKNKFVRFDKYGIYGINGIHTETIDGTTWKPSSNDEIDEKATFALTWDGLKVTGNDGVVARIGRLNDNIIEVAKPGEDPVFSIDTDGNVTIRGHIDAGSIGAWQLQNGELYSEVAEKGKFSISANNTSIEGKQVCLLAQRTGTKTISKLIRCEHHHYANIDGHTTTTVSINNFQKDFKYKGAFFVENDALQTEDIAVTVNEAEKTCMISTPVGPEAYNYKATFDVEIEYVADFEPTAYLTADGELWVNNKITLGKFKIEENFFTYTHSKGNKNSQIQIAGKADDPCISISYGNKDAKFDETIIQPSNITIESADDAYISIAGSYSGAKYKTYYRSNRIQYKSTLIMFETLAQVDWDKLLHDYGKT